MHTWNMLLLAATAFATGCAAIPLDKPRERGLYIEENTTAVIGRQVPSTELPNHGTTAGGVEKNNATHASIKTSDVLFLRSSPSNTSARISLQNKKLTDKNLSTRPTNKTEELVRIHPIPVNQSLRNIYSQSNNTNKTKVSKSSSTNSRNQEEVVPLQSKTIPTKLSNEDASIDRSLVGLVKLIKNLKLTKSNITDAKQQVSHSVPQENASLPASTEEESEKISVNATPSTSTINRSAASKLSMSPRELNTPNATNITGKAKNRIKIIFSDVDSNIGTQSYHVVQSPSPPPQVERNLDDDNLEINDRKNGTLLSAKSVEEDGSTGDHVSRNETVISEINAGEN